MSGTVLAIVIGVVGLVVTLGTITWRLVTFGRTVGNVLTQLEARLERNRLDIDRNGAALQRVAEARQADADRQRLALEAEIRELRKAVKGT